MVISFVAFGSLCGLCLLVVIPVSYPSRIKIGGFDTGTELYNRFKKVAWTPISTKIAKLIMQAAALQNARNSGVPVDFVW